MFFHVYEASVRPVGFENWVTLADLRWFAQHELARGGDRDAEGRDVPGDGMLPPQQRPDVDAGVVGVGLEPLAGGHASTPRSPSGPPASDTTNSPPPPTSRSPVWPQAETT